jgi:glycosyltransferase involved in cell wall biosynthesis
MSKDNKMFSVLHTESSTGWGGQESRTLQESIGMRKLGARIVLLCQPGSILGEKAEAEGFDVVRCRMKKSYDLFAVKNILRTIRSEKIDIVNTHSGRDTLLAGIAGRLSSRRPAVVRTRHLALPITSKFTYNVLAHRVVTVSEYVRNYLISEGIPASKVQTVQTCVDLEKFDPEKTGNDLRQELGLEPGVPVVGTVSILRRKKGHHILLDAIPGILKKVPEAVFVFAGNGPQKENIENRIKKLGLGEKVILLGLRHDIPNILNSIDLFVLPTLQEALGTSFVEAMAMGRPLIGADVGGVGELIKDGVNGYLVMPEDPYGLANAIIRILQNREKAEAMGREGMKMARQHFTSERMCREMYDLYASLLEKGAG